ncbi:MAG: hypothetical protein M1838_003493 [Thelocarpon superellum]|nr:MAG: hypothetical protein M1838_003493 [Thelocarpon superellum]
MKTAQAVPTTTASGRRQPVRQTRTNPPRAPAVAPRAHPAGRAADTTARSGRPPADAQPGFFPAITHFTDAITALPKEVVRHFTLLKEVDAKACGPEETLGQLTDLALHTPPPPRNPPSAASTSVAPSAGSANPPLPAQDASAPDAVVEHSRRGPDAAQPDADAASMARRHLFLNLRYVLSEMLMTLDEKNHVIATANEALQKQLVRANSSFPYIDHEISDEARYGSLTHWAYTDKTAGKVNGAVGTAERSRRDVAAANGLAAAAAALNEEAAAARSESRREAMMARRYRNLALDPDHEDGRARPRDPAAHVSVGPQLNKKMRGGANARRVADPAGPVGLGIAHGPAVTIGNPPVKRRRAEKAVNGVTAAAAAAASTERSMTGVFGNSGPATKLHGGSRAGTPNAEGAGRKRGRGGGGVGGPPRKRHNTNGSAIPSPLMASSPIQGTFTTTKDLPRHSPPTGANSRPVSARARKNSSHSVAPEATTARHRPSSSASAKAPPANGLASNSADADTAAKNAGRGTTDGKEGMTDDVAPPAEPMQVDGSVAGAGAGKSETNGTPVVSHSTQDTADHAVKGEEVETNHIGPPPEIRHTSISTTRKASKNSTPVTATFSDAPTKGRARPARAHANSHDGLSKRSHKKGAAVPAAPHLVLTVGAQPAAEEAVSAHDDDDEDDDTEPRYCYCNQVSYGEMVACDADNCPREWFHLDCVGLTKAPTKNAKWYCDECKENIKKSKVGGNGGGAAGVAVAR